MNNCFLLNLKICPYHERSCDKPCENYSVVGDSESDQFKEWKEIIDNGKLQMKSKYFGGKNNE